jgi:hypothetical protein
MANDEFTEGAAFSRTPHRAEKLTIGTPLSVRFTETQLLFVQRIADLNGMSQGEYIRHLVDLDEEKERRIWAARNQLFAPKAATPTHTTSDGVERD